MTTTPALSPWIGGATVPPGGRPADPVLFPYSGDRAALAVQGTADDFEAAVAAAQAGFAAMRALPRHARRDLLTRIADLLTRDRQALGAELAQSCGKPITQALGEVDRAILTFSLAADEARRFGGESSRSTSIPAPSA